MTDKQDAERRFEQIVSDLPIGSAPIAACRKAFYAGIAHRDSQLAVDESSVLDAMLGNDLEPTRVYEMSCEELFCLAINNLVNCGYLRRPLPSVEDIARVIYAKFFPENPAGFDEDERLRECYIETATAVRRLMGE